MADPTRIVTGSLPGPLFVDEECIDCNSCREIAEAFFAQSKDEPFSLVVKQPQSEAEWDLCKEAISACPVEAIGVKEE